MHRLNDVVNRTNVKRFDGVLVVSCHKDYGQTGLLFEQPLGQLQSAQLRHLDIEKHDIDVRPERCRQPLDGIGVLADNGHASCLQPAAQQPQREAFIVNHNRFQCCLPHRLITCACQCPFHHTMTRCLTQPFRPTPTS